VAKNRGQILEEQLVKSMPAGVYVRKLHTPAPPAARVDSVIGLLRRLADTLEKMGKPEKIGWAIEVLQQTRFTARSPYDHLIVAPAQRRSNDVAERYSIPADEGAILPLLCRMAGQDGMPLDMLVQPSVIFTLECKCAGDQKSFPFNRLEDHQEEGLVEAAAMGYVSGLILEFPAVGDLGELYFVPITSYSAYRRRAGRASLPLEACRDFGHLIEVDVGRGRVHRYWHAGDFLRAFGAAIPGAPTPRRAAAAASPGGSLFDRH
jgi:hypothetical protein